MQKRSGEDVSNARNTNVTAGATAGTATPNHAYIYGVGIAAFLAIDVCVFFAYNKKSFQTLNKEQVNEEQQQTIELPKRRNML